MVNSNGFIVWILLYIMTIWQYIAIMTLPMNCVGNNQIALASGSYATIRTCVMWYGQLSCWGYGICPLSFSILIDIFALCALKRQHSQKVFVVSWVKGVLRIIGILRPIRSVCILILNPFKLLMEDIIRVLSLWTGEWLVGGMYSMIRT